MLILYASIYLGTRQGHMSLSKTTNIDIYIPYLLSSVLIKVFPCNTRITRD